MKNMKTMNLTNLTLAALTGILVAGCGQTDPHFALLGKSQGLVSAPANNKVDIVWVIRNAGLMGPIQTNLATSFNSFMTQFVNKNFDYQMSVLTTDIRAIDPSHPADPNYSGQNSCIVGTPGIITPLTANPVSAFTTNSNVGYYGSTSSHNLSVLQSAFSAPNLTGCNAGLLRTGAYLAVIEVSDTDDDTATTAASTIAYLDSIKPATTTPNGVTIRPYSVSAIVVDNGTDKTACDAVGNTTFGTTGVSYSEIGTKLMSIASTTKGVTANVCATDFSSSLLAIGTNILEQTSAVHLSSVPDTATIQVYENTTTVLQSATNGWTYDATTTSIVLHGTAIPTSANIYVTVNYTPASVIN